ncbi:HNH endonuclease signature motif containing protein [Mycolicibacterium sphagni]|uniref:HNH endonuclease signature motif containing protein n=2 Tax=Mycolicibacterium sphagni TaxID=1786 RepID=UPI001F443F23|nr:HNH endonuclease signature motif containing protein [Mycolicibacterium sphagni]
MFDGGLGFSSDAAVVAVIGDSARAENQDAARRVAAIGELAARRCADDEHAHWACDEWDAAAAEVSAILGVTHGRASSEMHLALSLRHRLHKVAALFSQGTLGYRVCEAIVDRTDLIRDRATLALVDRAIADDAVTWGPLSTMKLQRAIDFWVDRYDPGAVRRTRSRTQGRDVVVDLRNAQHGVVEIRGTLLVTDATVMDRRLAEMVRGVCEGDPRSVGELRSDALGAIGAGSDRLACTCGGPDCPAAEPDSRAANVVVHVVAEAEPSSPRPATGIITGNRGIVPAPVLAELIESGAKVRELRRPGDEPEPGYRPSTALDEFVRMRDMTCRFPNCDKPAEYCDIDHTIPWPWGPTHASNLACVCRKHHLLKTFWAGWRDRQHPDGTIVWTSPTGHTYTTQPGSRLLIPHWNVTTATLPPPVGQPPPTLGIMMPTRRKTRAAQRAHRITTERKLNDDRVTERNKPPPF